MGEQINQTKPNSIGRGTLSRRHGKIPGKRWDVTVIIIARLGF
jgi:hypothetical protein